MGDDGNGSYSRTQADYVFDTVIDETQINSELNDIATALSNRLAKNGETTPTANLPMGGFKHTGMGDGSALTDSLSLGQAQDGAFLHATSVSGADTITAALTPAITAYATGQSYSFVSAGANTGAATINLNSVGAKAITKEGTTALEAGDIPSGAMVTVIYDGTQFQLQNVKNTVISNILSVTDSITAGTTQTQAGATALTTEFNRVTTATAGDGVKFPTASAGLICHIVNETAVSIEVYPNTSDTLNGGSANVSNSLGAKTRAIYECVDGTDWEQVSEYNQSAAATGGTITTDGADKIHTFTSSGTFEITNGNPTLTYLVVGGGGGGGLGRGGGGGAGGYRSTTLVRGIGSYTVTVGAGGAASTAGSDSVFDTITADGGGEGGDSNEVGAAGGSGGGGGDDSSGPHAGGAATSGQGNAGGTSINTPSGGEAGGGGGGASAVGVTATNDTPGAGGAGSANSISGSSVTYSGGGGGGGFDPGATVAVGGAGGGGAGGDGTTSPVAGTVNTGGGGGAGGRNGGDTAGAAGGDGIVIIRYTP